MLDFTVSEMEAPPADFDGKVNIKDFWDSVTSQIICSGLLTSEFITFSVVVMTFHHYSTVGFHINIHFTPQVYQCGFTLTS